MFQEAELYHICCCPGGCPEDGTKNRTVLQGVKRKDNKPTSTIISKSQDPFDSESEEIEEDNNNNNSNSSEEDPRNSKSQIALDDVRLFVACNAQVLRQNCRCALEWG